MRGAVSDPAASLRSEFQNQSRVSVFHSGLSRETGRRTLFGAGSLAGSIFEVHRDVAARDTEECEFERATNFLRRETPPGADVWMKLNCEGSEWDIVEDLIESGESGRLNNVLLDLDVRKIASQKHRELEILERIDRGGWRNVSRPEDVQYGQGSTFGRISNWLFVTGAAESRWQRRFQSGVWHAQDFAEGRFRGFYKLRLVRGLQPETMDFYYTHLRGRGAGHEV